MSPVDNPLIALFRFLKAFATSQQPLPRRLTDHPLANGYQFWHDLPLTSDYLRLSNHALEDRDFLFELTLPPQHACPEPPVLIADWLVQGWQEWRTEQANYLPEKTHKSSVGDTTLEQFDDQPERVEALTHWQQQRDGWRQVQQRHQPVRELFAWLQYVYTELQKQSGALELVLGCAVVQDANQRYQHPLLIKPVQLLFNVTSNTFRLEDGSHHTELYLPLLSELTENAALLAKGWHEQTLQLHPLDEAARLQTQVMQNLLTNQAGCQHLRLDYTPVLWVRARGAWSAQVANDIISQLEQQPVAQTPLYLQRLAGLVSGREQLADSHAPTHHDNILFALPANPEQFQLAQQLEQHDIVLVQGPPGTGKTHTIANLIGHLLAQKKRILVTSHSSKALRVLRDKVPAEIRSLCVSVLDDDKKSKLELAEAVAALSEKMTQAHTLEKSALHSRQQRQNLLLQEQHLLQQQRLCLEHEYRPISVAGNETAPSEAARIVYAGVGHHDWLPPLADHERGKACPLSMADLHWLYASQSLIPRHAEQELTAGLPALADLPTPEAWQHTLTLLSQYQHATNSRQRWLWSSLSAIQLARLSDALAVAQTRQQELDQLCRHGDWLAHIIESSLESQQNTLIWQELFELIEETHRQFQQAQSLLLDFAPELSAETLADTNTLTVLAEIHAYLQAGGSFNWWKMLVNPAWKKLLETARCNGSTVNQQGHIEALIAHVQLEQQQHRLLRRWQRQVASLGGIELPQQAAIKTAMDWLPSLKEAFSWGQTQWPHFVQHHVEPLGVTLTAIEQHIAPQSHSPTPRLQRLKLLLQHEIIPEWQAHLARSSAEQVALTIEHSQQRLQPFLANRPADSVIQVVLSALQQHDVAAYQAAYQQLQSLHALKHDFNKRLQHLEILEKSAKQWAQAIRLRQPPHHQALPKQLDFAAAWQWRQFHDELHYRQQLNLERITSQLQLCRQDLQRVTGELISQQTWAHQAHAAEPYRQPLIGWQQTQTKIGKGTGKHVQRLRLLAQQQLQQAQYAVPVWIMPQAEVFCSFKADNQFDVVIVDEASQVDITGLLVTYLGKKVVIVGDDEQVSPDAVGTDSELATRLQQEYLHHVPNAHLYDGQTSLYDLTKQVARGQLCLREHFRCVPAIIGFSNQLSYQGRIKALREPASSPLTAHIVPYRVQGQRTAHKTNLDEAQTIVRLIQAMCQHPAYQGKTLGVISLLGNNQVTLIESELRKALPMSLIEERRLLCGNSAQFQGDERDVILLSMVDSNEGDGPMRLQGDGARDMSKKRYNVAASRAKDQLWIVHSVDYQTDLKPHDLRRQLLEYAHSQAQNFTVDDTQHLTESPFEEAVLKQLLARGYTVQTQYAVGYYRIDMVVMGDNARLAVECDGDKYHSGSEKISEDLARQAILERLGWQFWRIRGSAFFRQPEQALEGLWQRLAELEIRPQQQQSTQPEASPELLHQDIIRRAEQLQTSEPLTNKTTETALPNHDSINDMFRKRSAERHRQQHLDSM